MCQLKLEMTAETEQHAVMSKTYCAREYSVKLAKYICIQKVRTCSINSGGIGIPSHKPAHWKVSPISAIRKDNLNTYHSSQHPFPDSLLPVHIFFVKKNSVNIILNSVYSFLKMFACVVYKYKYNFHTIHSNTS